MVATFKHDAQGFLIGQVIENGRDMLRAQTQSYGALTSIRADVRALRRMMGDTAATAVRMSRPGAAPRAAVVVAAPSRAARTADGNYGSGPRPVAITPQRGSALPPAVVSRTSARATAVVAQPRGAGGRFIAKPAVDTPKGEGVGSSGGGGSSAAMRRLSDSVGKLASAVGSAENIDPVVNATKELSSVVTPLGRGMFSLLGRSAERRKEVWYRRFLKALTPKKASDRPAGGVALAGGGGTLGGLGAGLGRAAGMGFGAAAGGLLAKGKGLFGRGAGLLRRVPVLGALLAGGSALSSIFGDESRDAKYKGVGEAGGMLAGGLAGAQLGAAIGTAIAPGIGTAIGGFLGGVGGALLGEKFGAKVAEWTKTLVDADLAGKALAAWNVTTSAIGAAWESLAKDAGTAWDAVTAKASEWLGTAKTALESVGATLSNAGAAVNDWIKSKTGIDVRSAAAGAWSATKDAGGSAWSAAKDYGAAAATALTPNTVKRAISAGGAAATQAKAGYDEARGIESAATAPLGAVQRGARRAGSSLGDLIARGEGDYGSFNRGVAGDARGAKMDFANMTVGEIMAAQALPKGDANRLFAVGKYQVTPEPMLGAVQALGLKGNEKFTPELQERIFAEYLTNKKRPQIAGYIKGEHDDLGAAQLAGAREWASIADPRTGRSFYAGTANNAAHLSAGQFGVSLTAAREQYKALVGSGMDAKSAYTAAVVGSSMPKVGGANVPTAVPVNIPRPPEVKDPATPLNSLSGEARREAIQLSVPETIGQNVSDRGIAHVVTGGLGLSGMG